MGPKLRLITAACCVVFILENSGVSAVRCFECNSHNDSRCAEKQPPEELRTDCATKKDGAKYTMCRKIVQIIEFSVNGLPPNTRVIRTCGYDESNYKGRCYQRGGFGGRQEVCSCLKDYCNAATPGAIPVSKFLMISCLLSSLIYAFTRN
ncbi:uncharacterized protein LOC117181445 [Belonocnema kinseyi]|uniref:uncharacterized protein LOC117181445 n=1 Tax=Belonocnema kinseyi TaxID=2817044 RepID=UPI00143D8F09|nr:uncharacterized protein LOC117181445 [Belonocnema kinseyi]